jgi:diguanylate cyclase (GGDEF)-like protein
MKETIETPLLDVIQQATDITAEDMLRAPVDNSPRIDLSRQPFPRTVDVARRWFADLNNSTLTDQQRRETLEYYVHTITAVSDYGNLNAETVQTDEGKLLMGWLVEDIGRLALLVRGPTVRNLDQYKLAVKTAHHIVSRTLELAHSEHEQWNLNKAKNTDKLTGNLNRDGYDIVRDTVLARADITGEPVAETLIDLTDFKQLNDVLGYDIGDAALCETRDDVKRHIRQGDWWELGRVGGDEFKLLHSKITVDAYASFLRRFIGDQMGKVTTSSQGVPSPYATAWAEIAKAEAQGERIKEHAHIVFEEADVPQYDRDPVKTLIRVLYIGERRIAPLRDMVILSVGGAYGDSSHIRSRSKKEGQTNMGKHKADLHVLMGGAYKRRKVVDKEDDAEEAVDEASGRIVSQRSVPDQEKLDSSQLQ